MAAGLVAGRISPALWMLGWFRRAISSSVRQLQPETIRTGRKHVSGGRCHGGPPRLTGKARHTGVTAQTAMISLGLVPELPNSRSTMCRMSGGTLLGAGCRRLAPISSQEV